MLRQQIIELLYYVFFISDFFFKYKLGTYLKNGKNGFAAQKLYIIIKK